MCGVKGDVLVNEDGDLMPVQWTGYDSRLGQYQGEVLSKDIIHDRFRAKLRAAKMDPGALVDSHWEDLRAVFESIFSAFHSFDGAQICSRTREYYSTLADN